MAASSIVVVGASVATGSVVVGAWVGGVETAVVVATVSGGGTVVSAVSSLPPEQALTSRVAVTSIGRARRIARS